MCKVTDDMLIKLLSRAGAGRDPNAPKVTLFTAQYRDDPVPWLVGERRAKPEQEFHAEYQQNPTPLTD